jgi:hypothetical protein
VVTFKGSRRGIETIADFSLETSTQSKLLRQRLEAIFEEWRAPFASRIAEGQALGEIESSFDPRSSRISPRFQGGRNSPHEGRTQPRRTRPLQGHSFRNHIFQTKCKE